MHLAVRAARCKPSRERRAEEAEDTLEGTCRRRACVVCGHAVSLGPAGVGMDGVRAVDKREALDDDAMVRV